MQATGMGMSSQLHRNRPTTAFCTQDANVASYHKMPAEALRSLERQYYMDVAFWSHIIGSSPDHIHKQ